MTHFSPAHFVALFDQNSDPWGFRTRWYEARKRALTLACLPRQKYRFGYEPGCANGELAAALATRCERLIVSDGASNAVAASKTRLVNELHVEVQELLTPSQWPTENFDLIVVSEMAYYLDASGFADLCALLRDGLNRGATIVGVHWRRPIEGCAFTGDDIHAVWGEQFQQNNVANYRDDDLNLDVWSSDQRSVARCDGLV